MKITITMDLTQENLNKLRALLPESEIPGQMTMLDAPSETTVEPAATLALMRQAAIAAQRFIVASDADKYVNYLKEIGFTEEQLNTVCGDYIRGNANFFGAVSAHAATVAPAPAPAPEEPKTEERPITKTDIRAVALKLSKAGKQKELAEVFGKFGCKKLSDFDDRTDDYPALMKELVSVNG